MTAKIWIAVIIKRDRDDELAILVDAGVDNDIWIPRSQISDQTEDPFQENDSLEIEIPEWLALNKGLI